MVTLVAAWRESAVLTAARTADADLIYITSGRVQNVYQIQTYAACASWNPL